MRHAEARGMEAFSRGLITGSDHLPLEKVMESMCGENAVPNLRVSLGGSYFVVSVDGVMVKAEALMQRRLGPTTSPTTPLIS